MLAELPDDIFMQIIIPIVSKRTIADLRLTSKVFYPKLLRISTTVCPKPNYYEPHTNSEYFACLMHQFVIAMSGNKKKSYLNKTLQQHFARVGLLVRNYAMVKDWTTSFVMKNLIHAITFPRRYYYFGILNRNHYLYPLLRNSNLNINNILIEDSNKLISDLICTNHDYVDSHEDIIKIINLYQENANGTSNEIGIIQIANQIFGNPNNPPKLRSTSSTSAVLEILMANFSDKIVDNYVNKLTKSHYCQIMMNATRYGRADLYETYNGLYFNKLYHDQTFALNNIRMVCYKERLDDFNLRHLYETLIHDNYPVSSLRRCKINLQHILQEPKHLTSHYITALLNEESLYRITNAALNNVMKYKLSLSSFMKFSYDVDTCEKLYNAIKADIMSDWKETNKNICEKKRAKLLKSQIL